MCQSMCFNDVVHPSNICHVCQSTEQIIYSGVDAFMLAISDLTEKICYPCANKRRPSLS
jgi:hypothetical protein